MSDPAQPAHIKKIQNDIELHFHCRKCLTELTSKSNGAPCSPKDYSRLTVGWTQKGVQVWCIRHDENVFHIDFKGQKVTVA